MRDTFLMKTLDQIEKLYADFEHIVFPHSISHLVVDVNERSTQFFHDDEPRHIGNLELCGVNAVRLASVDKPTEPDEVRHRLKDLEFLLELVKAYAVHKFDHKVSF